MINEVIKKNGITYGVIIGIVLALITAIMYSIDLKLFVSGWIGGLTFVIFLAITIALLVKTKKDLNNIFSFKDAFTTYFIAVLIGILISTFFNIILFNFIDPSAKETLGELIRKYMAETLQKFGTPASVINETLAKMKESNPYATGELLKALVFSIVGYSILGLILAAFFKSKTTYQE
ncbi:hypothetical protein OA93_06080 [Flavobacterium sp. KMS]|jgi:hypothetical protein|uniref:DUF4199 domain-containing protein n=1 Tax=Flavobacterium sp. KMS TaxID=1566023 RepID=UPI00057F1F35|nr:DUF4199 domain-containing protein [Flavobacterium sp. KMS]KIA99196.1 hypothetical protein OA93_06080 [Flavobacterium sp. KMS]